MKKKKAEERGLNPEDAATLIEHVMRKIAFVREFFSHSVPDDELLE